MQTSHAAFRESGADAQRPVHQRWLALFVVLLGIPLALCTHNGRQVTESEPSVAFGPPNPNVYIALHLEEPLAPNRTVVWTAAFQAAWDQLADVLKMPDGLALAAPAQMKAVRALNAGRLAPGVVAPGNMTVIAGPATEATWAAIARASGQPRPQGAPAPNEQDTVAFARLKASVRYEAPFFVAEKPLQFGPQQVPVKAWGLRRDAQGEAAQKMRQQVRIHTPSDAGGGDVAQIGVVVITAKGGTRIVISGRAARETLARTWQDVAAVIAAAPGDTFSLVDRLTIPRVSIVAGRAYDEIAPAPFEASSARLALARQDVSLVLDERGADVDAEAVLMGVGAVPREVDIEGPFLVALLARGSQAPYVLAWIGSENGLTPWGAPIGRALTAAEARPFVGAWVLDARASVDETVAAIRRVVGPAEARRARVTRKNVSEWIRGRPFAVEVNANGDAHVKTTDKQSTPADLRRDGARFFLGAPKRGGGGHETWDISRDGGHLRLHLRGRSEVLVLRQR